MTDAPDFIATLTKNSREDVRVSLAEFGGVDLVDLRIWASFDGAERRPTKKGVSLKVTSLSELIKGLQAARDEAQRRGLIE